MVNPSKLNKQEEIPFEKLMYLLDSKKTLLFRHRGYFGWPPACCHVRPHFERDYCRLELPRRHA